MITAQDFIGAAARYGFDFYTGVPCSFLAPLINGVLNEAERAPGSITYVGATSEGEAVAIGAGAWLAGRRPVMLCQNSGLGNAVNPLTSLTAPFDIPLLVVTSWRGQPGLADEPQHKLMGQITPELISLIGLEQAPFPTTPAALAATLARLSDSMAIRAQSFALVMEKDSVAPEPLLRPSRPVSAPPPLGRRVDFCEGGERPTRFQALGGFLMLTDDTTAVIATTGKCSRELFTQADRRQHLYLVGAMGSASALGLGVALNTARRVVVLDGDGAALMKLGNFATIGAQAPANLHHIVLDNGVHDSTGGQETVSAGVDFAAVALACGYRYAASCDSLGGLAAALAGAEAAEGPALIHLRIRPGSITKLGRPNVAPREVARRFRAFLGGGA